MEAPVFIEGKVFLGDRLWHSFHPQPMGRIWL
jgi:hypothetical protein